MRSLLSACLLLVPALALAEPTPLTSVEQVQKLCGELQGAQSGTLTDPAMRAQAEASAKGRRDAALQQEYRLTLPPGQFKIAEADAASGTLSVDTQRAFRMFKGQAVFYPVDEQDLDLAVPEGQPLPGRTDDLALELVVRPGQDAEQPCYQGLSKDYVMGVEVLSARLVNKAGATVAQLEEDEGIDRQRNTKGSAAVEIEPAVVEGSAAVAQQVTEGVQQLKNRLTECYQKGLAREPGLDGALVLGFDLSPQGKPGEVTVMADSVQDDAVTQCVAQTVSGLSLKSTPAKGKKGSSNTVYNGRASVALRFARK